MLNNAINIERFRFDPNARDDCRKEFGLKDEFVIGHVGHFTEQKNHVFLIDVFEEYHHIVPHSKLLLVSDGPKISEIKHRVDEYGLSDSVIFTGSRSDTERLYCAMDVFVFPSKWEGLPLTLIEAQANGLPCYTSEVIPNATRISDHIEYISLEQSPEYWAKKVLKYENNLDYRKMVSHIACTTLIDKGYNIKVEASKLKKTYIVL